MRVNLPNLSYAFAHPTRTYGTFDIGIPSRTPTSVVSSQQTQSSWRRGRTTGQTRSKWQSSGHARPSIRLNRFHLPLLQLLTLEGAADVLKSVSAIHMEVSNVRLYEGAPPYSEVRARMADWGFVPTIEAFFRVSGNVLFVRRRAN